jgi:predicted Zn finger-like uncharacterized protein
MILTCPECQTRYRADAAQFPAEGRKVRCAKCGHLWQQLPPDPEPEPVPAPAIAGQTSIPAGTGAGPVSTATQAEPRQRIASERSLADRLGILAGWLALGAMVFLIGWTGFRFREEIATLWPQSSSLFATFGVAVNARGIAIDDWSYHRELENGQPVMVVTGKLVNRSAHELTVPPVQVTLTDDDERELYHWTFKPPQPTLSPGQSLGFSSRLPNPPSAARHLQLRFASQD